MAPNGFLHAGSLVTLADTCAGYGCIANLPGRRHGFTTMELKSNHLGTAREGMVDCVATPAIWAAPPRSGTRWSRTGTPARRWRCSAARRWCCTRSERAQGVTGVPEHPAVAVRVWNIA
jgi:hypothetical protein